jgi:DNA-binding transcriptional ArsR family regulator
MDMTAALDALGALAQEGRLKAFRLLVEGGEDGLPAGEIARRCGVPHNTMSAQLGALAGAGLVRARRAGRSIIYAADFDGVRGLLEFLMRDCCHGRPEKCARLLDAVLPAPERRRARA